MKYWNLWNTPWQTTSILVVSALILSLLCKGNRDVPFQGAIIEPEHLILREHDNLSENQRLFLHRKNKQGYCFLIRRAIYIFREATVAEQSQHVD